MQIRRGQGGQERERGDGYIGFLIEDRQGVVHCPENDGSNRGLISTISVITRHLHAVIAATPSRLWPGISAKAILSNSLFSREFGIIGPYATCEAIKGKLGSV